MAIDRPQDETNDYEDEYEPYEPDLYGFGESSAGPDFIEAPDVEAAAPSGPISGPGGSTDRPAEIPGISDVDPTTPIDANYGARCANTGAPKSAQVGGAGYTPERPRQPVSTPGAFSSMAPLPGASPSAMSASLRAPYISEPAQYNPTGGGPRLRGAAGGLLRGGLGGAGGGRGIDTVLSSLIKMILQGQR